ncbi:MAG: DUF4105 domain-containing protein [Prevotella sp.]|nr:DUF4105 domain-containing protein [Prevotella sp.]
MKTTKGILQLVFWACALLCSAPAGADEMDSVDISLLTCSPHEEVYSLYGHTAIRVNDRRTGDDIAVNYGMFSFQEPYFTLRFLFGIPDYEMGIEPFEAFCMQYRSYGSSVTQQTLNLTADEKRSLIAALQKNYQPEHRKYRYNIFYDNCTTRARDMIVSNIVGDVQFDGHQRGEISFREMIHACNGHHPWARFGKDMLLGMKADWKTDINQQQFLPANTMDDFDRAVIRNTDGSTRPLVSAKSIVVEEGTQIVENDFPLRPRECALILLAVTIAVTIAEFIKKKRFWGYDALLMSLTGVAGIVLTLMIFSQHPTVSLNLQILLFNPLYLLFVWRMVKRTKNRLPDRQHRVWLVLICLFFIGGIFQAYAEGAYLLASSLLMRNVTRLR